MSGSTCQNPYANGVLAALGIAEGTRREPTARQREVLVRAPMTGWKMAKNIAVKANQSRSGVRLRLRRPGGRPSNVVVGGALTGSPVRTLDTDRVVPPGP
ncbi:hypothetical protein [Promicromonospora sp. NPDC090134]|uniref:hypothetical protein n=1 Tax=Promicromonospora sp. NPDC090134 TaxID=3364408 RepID=UPI0037F7E7D0